VKLTFSNIVGDNATIRLYKHIGFDPKMGAGVDGDAVAWEINYINENYPHVKNIDVRINSPGGSVHEGLSICSAILNSSTHVTTHVDGMAYSMGGVIAVCGHRKVMYPHSTFMMHDASGGDDEKVLDLITNSLAKIFENNTTLTLEKCRSMMKKETWLSGDECKSMGFEILPSAKKKPAIANVLELHNFYNSQLQTSNQKTMIKLNNMLKLSNEASEEAREVAVQTLITDNAAVTLENQNLKTEKEALETKLKKFETSEAEKEKAAKDAVIADAVKAGKLTDVTKVKYENGPLKADELKEIFEDFKATVQFTPAFDPKKVVASADANRATWTYDDWQKKDSAGLLEIQNSNPTEFERLVKTINTTFKSKI
jgi:ATP-dependent protease ClpP protease subunit